MNSRLSFIVINQRRISYYHIIKIQISSDFIWLYSAQIGDISFQLEISLKFITNLEQHSKIVLNCNPPFFYILNWICFYSPLNLLCIFSSDYRVPTPLDLTGPLEVNNFLDKAERLFEGQVHGPETLLKRGNEIYTSIHGGEVIKIIDDHITHVAKFGKPCGKSCFTSL